MSAIRLGAAANIRGFQNLLNALAVHDAQVLDPEALQDEFGRLRVWAGNLGALQKGHSSLDYRLRDAPLLSNEVLKLLKELEENLNAAHEIVTGARLPYEQQKPDDEEQDDKDDFFSEDEDEGSDLDVPKSELSMRYHEVLDIINHMYKISVRIRAPTVRTRSLKAASYRPKDPETGVDLLEQYALFDIQHTTELVKHLRQPHVPKGEDIEEHDVLVMRLARAVTLRRRQFKYWRRHREKLGVAAILEEPQGPAAVERPGAPHRYDTLDAQPGTPYILAVPKLAHSQKTGKTLLSGTEATHHHQSLDDIVDSKSVTSYAVTVKDISGKGIDLPPPPKTADGDKEFECPYCYIICPARYGKGRPWRTHVLQDLQPYVCTYTECQTSEQLFRSRRDWVEHESSHRKAWRCPEHPEAVYKNHASLEEHLRKDHGDSIPEGGLSSIVKVGETNTVDERQKCPICWASIDTKGMGTLQNHIANHLERVATFSLPVDIDDTSGGGSSRASRGGIESSAMHSATQSSDASDASDYSDIDKAQYDDTGTWFDSDAIGPSAAGSLPEQINDEQRGLLTKSLIGALPDDSRQRLDLLFTNKEDEEQSGSDWSMEDESPDTTEKEVEEHMAEREVFRKYLLSLPGAQSVRFYRRYGSWVGNINFKDGDFAAMALRSFDMALYPKVRLRQKVAKKESLKFSVLQHQQTKQVSFRSKGAVADRSTVGSVSSASQSPATQRDAQSLAPIMDVNDIANLRTLYRSGGVVQRDDPYRSYAPSDAYNGIIAFCSYDITRVKVDAIVNSSNRALVPSRAEWTLNSIIHKAAGPKLQEECSRLNKLKPSQAVLTGGYQLPCTHIIHVARPHYASSKGMGQYNLLTECYRSALKLAMNQNLKTIAFCCLGTGGVGFPARVAARIALQETREFLDAHQTHPFERIVFCAYSEEDAAAYPEFFPNFFPPTHDDLENTVSNKRSRDRDRLSALVQEVYTQVNNVTQEVKMFSVEAKDMPQRVVQDMSSIAVLLDSFKELVIRPEGEAERLLSRMMGDLDLLCSVMLAVCGNMTEMAELAKGKENLGQPSYKAIWHDYNSHMEAYQGLTIVQLIDICEEFAQHLNNVLEQNTAIPNEMKAIGTRLGAWLAKQTGVGKSVRDHFEEVMITREFQRNEIPKDRGKTVKLYQIPTLAQLYGLDTLQSDFTHSAPSSRSYYMVCLSRDDITRLEVDVIVSSTDIHFSGMGRLARSVFQAGGLELQEECASNAPCTEGDVILTGGYSLPAKHVLHAIPPDLYRTGTQDILRNMYRKILRMAASLRAASVAIPALGTGLLNYPRRDSAVVAIEEVKNFIDTVGESSTIEKIVLVVFSSNDEFMYKSLIPVYFPAPNAEASEAAPILRELNSPPLHTLSDTHEEASRNTSSGKQPVIYNMRPLESSALNALFNFEAHARECQTCSNMSTLYSEGKDLCDEGYPLAAKVLRHLYMKPDQSVHPLRSDNTDNAEVYVPVSLPLGLELLSTVEKSLHDPNRDRPFVSNQPALGKIRRPGYTVHRVDVTVSAGHGPGRTFSRIHVWSDPVDGWGDFQGPVPTLHLTRGALVIREADNDSISTWLYLNSQSRMSRPSDTEILVQSGEGTLDDEPNSSFSLTFNSLDDCDMMLTRLKHAANNSPTVPIQEIRPPPGAATNSADVPIPSQHEAEKAFAKVSFWAHSARRWVLVNSYDSEASLYITPGYLEIAANSAGASSSVRSRLILTPLSIIRRHSSVEILLDNVITEDKPTADTRRYMLKFTSQRDCDAVLPNLTKAIQTSPHVASQYSTEDDSASYHISSDNHGLRDQLQALKQLWKADEEHLGRQSPTEASTDLDLPSVPQDDPVRRPVSATDDMRITVVEDRIEKLHSIATASGPSSATARDNNQYAGPPIITTLERRILTHIQPHPEDQPAVVSNFELANELDESQLDLTEAIEHLRALNMITTVPGLEHSWITINSQSSMPLDAQPSRKPTTRTEN
ncbi:hypothetical protein BU23DRAFT_173105 [Bimuria novae-zelandiae CBS 107.79]|uniref:Macro domain-containing protein n=1 Tax=Bimuria novae-zelandiae CBS 107.79 TaxID=1447943 RepID=A0A6A5V3G9_9PLEO|nr:hypothetical protein BU23DRAFT_173105 [Bimuria novae-zelandiae CBS 107.79]